MLIKTYIKDEEVVKQINEFEKKCIKINNGMYGAALHIYYDYVKIVNDELCFYTNDKLTIALRMSAIKVFSFTSNSIEIA